MKTPQIELTGDERAAIRDLVLSDTWKTLVERVWGPQMGFYRELCCTNATDLRFTQGLYQGFGFAMQMPVMASKPEGEVQGYTQADESDLMARKR